MWGKNKQDAPKKRSFFERLTGSIKEDENEELDEKDQKNDGTNHWIEEDNEEAELAVDVYQTDTEIVIQTMVAGVKPEDLEITIGREMATISGKRENTQMVDEQNYFLKELYWGKFGRTILLPQEVEPEQVEATEKYGLLTVKVRKVDKEKKNIVKVKSV